MKSDILANAEYTPTEIGKMVYLWSAGKRARNQTCVISAHGCQALISSPRHIPQVPLYFYCPNGYALKIDLEAVATGYAKPYEKIPAGFIQQDYVLTKFQKDPNARVKETYTTIQRHIHPACQNGRIQEDYQQKVAQFQKLVDRGMATKAAMKEKIAEYDVELNRLLQGVRPVIRDVVTIRNRKREASPTLFEVVHLLRKFNYTEVHCSFCRSLIGGDDFEYDNLHEGNK